MKFEEIQQFISTTHALVNAAKVGWRFEEDNKAKKQLIDQLTAKLSAAKNENAQLNHKCAALEQRCDELTDRLRKAEPVQTFVQA